jgi:hypothetical protein
VRAAVLAAIAGFLLASGGAHAARPAIKDIGAAGRAGTWPASSWIVHPLFYADGEAIKLLEADVLHPLARPRTLRRTLRLGAGRERHFRVSTPWDGLLRATAPAARVRVLDGSGRPIS